jgi:hypothetical protein
LISAGVDLDRFAPGRKRRLIAVETNAAGLAATRGALRGLRELDGWEIALARMTPLAGRPGIPLGLRDRVRVRSVRRSDLRAALLREAAIFAPTLEGSARLRLEAMASGCAIADPPGAVMQPELVSAAIARLAEDHSLCERRGAEACAAAKRRASRPLPRSSKASIQDSRAAAVPTGATANRSPTGTGSSPTCTCIPAGRMTARSSRLR